MVGATRFRPTREDSEPKTRSQHDFRASTLALQYAHTAFVSSHGSMQSYKYEHRNTNACHGSSGILLSGKESEGGVRAWSLS